MTSGEYNDINKPDLATFFSKYLEEINREVVLHIGAHQGQEVNEYLKQGFKEIILVEANPEWANLLRKQYKNSDRIKVFNYAITDTIGHTELLIHTSRTGSNEPASILPMKKFSEIVKTLHTKNRVVIPAITIDSLFEKYNLNRNIGLLNIDIQGAELLALKGGKNNLNNVESIICEVQLIELYQNAPHEDDITSFLKKYNFKKKAASYYELYDEQSSFPAWGEVLYKKEA